MMAILLQFIYPSRTDLIVLLPLAFLIGVILYCVALPKPLEGIPYNKAAAARLFGDLPDIRRSRYRRPWIWRQPGEHGSPVSQAFLSPFGKPTVIISDYRTAIDICSRRRREFDRGQKNRECVGVTAPHFHFTMESRDPRFKAHRRMVDGLMSPEFINEVAGPHVCRSTAELVRLWEMKRVRADGRPFDALRDLYMMTLDMISSVAFNMDSSKASLRREIEAIQQHGNGFRVSKDGSIHFQPAPTDPDNEALFDIAKMISIAQGSPWPTLAQWLALLNPFNLEHARAFFRRRSLLQHQTALSLHRLTSVDEQTTPKSALEYLLRQEQKTAESASRAPEFYSPAIRDEVLGYLLAGHDTTATVLAWFVKYMTRHQDVQTRLRQSLQDAHAAARADGRLPTASEIASIPVPYLDAVIEETLRCASVATLIVREATCATEILGYHIPKGTKIMIPLTGPSITEPDLAIPDTVRPAVYGKIEDRLKPWLVEDIGEYNPDRWLISHTDALGGQTVSFNPQAGPNLAFSTGPRQCFGKKQAQLQLKTTATVLLLEFVFEAVEGPLNGWEIEERLVNLPRQCNVKLSRAKDV